MIFLLTVPIGSPPKSGVADVAAPRQSLFLKGEANVKSNLFHYFLSMFLICCGAAAAQPPEIQPPADAEQVKKDLALAEMTSLFAKHKAAIVDVDGTLVGSFHAIRAKRLATGVYEVVFDRPVNKSAYSATLATPGISGAPEGLISLSPRLGNVHAVFVVTRDAQGRLADRAFHLWVLTF